MTAWDDDARSPQGEDHEAVVEAESPVTALLTVRPIAKGPRQRAPFADRSVKTGDIVDLVYVHGSDYTDTRRGEVVRRYVSGSVEVRFTEPTRRTHG